MSKKFLIILIILLLIFPPSLLGAPGLARSAGAIWELEESSGTRYDSVTQGVGPAAQFTAASSKYLSIADNASVSTGDIDYTWEAWVYLDSKSANMWAVSKSSAGQREYDVRYASGSDRFVFEIQNATNTGAGTATANNFGAVPTGQWIFVVAWHDSVGDTVNIQVNNGTADSVSYAGGGRDGTSELQIGHNPESGAGVGFWNGRIALVGFWKRVLTAAERTELYNSGKGYAYRDLSSGLKTSLISYWNLNESAGVRFDSHGSNDLQDNNTVTQATGVRGDNTLGRAATPYAAQFTAANSEYLSIADNAALSVNGSDFSFVSWIRFDSLPAANNLYAIAAKQDHNSGTNREWYVAYRTDVGGLTGKFEFYIFDSTGATDNVLATTFGTPLINTWYMIAVTYSNTNDRIRISINAGTQDQAATTKSIQDSTIAFVIGDRGPGETAVFFDGRIALAGFWKTELTANQIAHLYNSGKGLTYSELSRTLPSLTTSLNAYWNLNEASGTRADSAGSNNLTDNNTVTQNAGVPRGSAGTVPQAAGRGKSSISAQFTAANSEYLSIPDNAALSMGAGVNMSVAAWVYLDALPALGVTRFLVGKWGTSNSEYVLEIDNTGGTIRFRGEIMNTANTTATTIAASTFGTPSAATWYFLFMRYNGTNLGISVNDGTVDTAATTGGVRDGTSIFQIGARDGGAAFHDGRISKVGVWKKDLSAQEITDLYNSGRGNMYDGAAFYKDTAGTLKTSLQAWWELDELAGTRFDKVSPGVGPAAHFAAASSQYLSVADNASLSVANEDFSIAGWVYLDSLMSNDRALIGKTQLPGNPNTIEYYLYVQSSNFKWFVSVDGGGAGGCTAGTSCLVTDTTVLSPNTWYFVVAWYDKTAGQIRIRTNDATTFSQAWTGGSNDGPSPFALVNKGSSFGYQDGRIQLVGLWKRVLSASEITSLYNSGTGRHCKDLNDQLRRKLISYWNLNEGSGTRYDCVGANDLTDNNTVTQATGVAGGNSLGDNATVTHQQGLPWWTKARASGQFTRANSEYLSIADNADLSTGDIDFSIAVWVYIDSKPSAERILGKGNSATDNREWFLSYDISADRFEFTVCNNGLCSAGVSVAANVLGSPSTATWYFIVAYHDSVNNLLSIQVNNGTATTASYSLGAFDGTGPFQLGAAMDATAVQFFDGRIDEVGFWKKVLTAQERTDLYNSGKANRYNGNSFDVDTNGTLTTSLIAYWTLDEATGTRYDSKGANHLTDNNTVTQNVGINGTAAAQFTAANSEYLSIPDNAALGMDEIDMTLCAWVYPDSINERVVISKAGGGGYQLSVVSTSGKLGFDFANDTVGSTSFNSPPLVTGVWYFVCGWHDAAENVLRFQINNWPMFSKPHATTATPVTGTVRIGSSATPDRFWDGRIDQVMFFKRVLTESERAALWNEGTGFSYARVQKGFKRRSLE